MNIRERDAYRERMTRLAARVSEAQGIAEVRKQRAQGLMVRVGKGHRTIITQGYQRGVNGGAVGVKEHGWNGVPHGIPSEVYPNRARLVKRRDLTVRCTTHSNPVDLPPTMPYVADIKASDIEGRASRPEKSERIMREALKGYSNRV